MYVLISFKCDIYASDKTKEHISCNAVSLWQDYQGVTAKQSISEICDYHHAN